MQKKIWKWFPPNYPLVFSVMDFPQAVENLSAVPRCSGCTSKPFSPKPCKEALCGEKTPRGTVNEQGVGRAHLAGEALLIMPGGVESPISLLVVWGLLPPLGLQRTEQHLRLIVYLPGASPLPSGDLGWGGTQRGLLIGIFPETL